MKVLVPTSIVLALPPVDAIEWVRFDPMASIPAEHHDAEVLVDWGIPGVLLAEAATTLSSLRLVQLLSAGSDAAVAAGFAPDVVITSGRSLHDLPVSEHALALTLAAARRLHTAVRSQIGHRWAPELGGAQPEPSPGLFSTLRNARVLIWGFGSIATTLAPHLTALGASVTGVATTSGTRSGYPVISVEDLETELPHTDVLIMILPSIPSTAKALNAARIALLPNHAWLINVGRGSTVDEQALLAALQRDELGGAAMDVTTIEPLPANSPLWDEPRLIITPHAAGGRPLGAAELLVENLAALQAGTPLRNLVQR